MVSYKLDKYDRMFIAFVCVLVVLFNIGTLVFATEQEEVDVNYVNGLFCSSSTNYFVSNSQSRVCYFTAERNYKYTITNNYSSTYINLVKSNGIPSANDTYEYIISISPGSSYSFIASEDINYICGSVASSGNNFTIVKEEVEGINSAVSGLVDNVGINNFWNVFEGGIDFVGVVVLVAFGLFLVVLAIKKVSKGKSEF